MTSKEKAIEVLKQYNLTIDLVSIKYRLQQSYSKLLVDYIKANETVGKYGIEFNAAFSKRWADIKEADMFILCNYPTLDDAIKVVESKLKSIMAFPYANDYQTRAYLLNDILAALKGLKEGKEK